MRWVILLCLTVLGESALWGSSKDIILGFLQDNFSNIKIISDKTYVIEHPDKAEKCFDKIKEDSQKLIFDFFMDKIDAQKKILGQNILELFDAFDGLMEKNEFVENVPEIKKRIYEEFFLYPLEGYMDYCTQCCVANKSELLENFISRMKKYLRYFFQEDMEPLYLGEVALFFYATDDMDIVEKWIDGLLKKIPSFINKSSPKYVIPLLVLNFLYKTMGKVDELTALDSLCSRLESKDDPDSAEKICKYTYYLHESLKYDIFCLKNYKKLLGRDKSFIKSECLKKEQKQREIEQEKERIKEAVLNKKYYERMRQELIEEEEREKALLASSSTPQKKISKKGKEKIKKSASLKSLQTASYQKSKEKKVPDPHLQEIVLMCQEDHMEEEKKIRESQEREQRRKEKKTSKKALKKLKNEEVGIKEVLNLDEKEEASIKEVLDTYASGDFNKAFNLHINLLPEQAQRVKEMEGLVDSGRSESRYFP